MNTEGIMKNITKVLACGILALGLAACGAKQESESETPAETAGCNPNGYQIIPLEAAQLPLSLPDLEAAVINGNYALESGLNDCTIEVLKHVALYKRMPKGLPSDTEFRFGGVVPEDGDNRFLLFHCVSPSLDESKVVTLPYSSYEDMAKDSMIEKIFEQDADFPEISQTYLNKILVP